MKYLNLIKNIKHKKHGASLTGYALLVGLIGVIAIATIENLGTNIAQLFDNVGDDMDQVSGGTTNTSSNQAPTYSNGIITIADLTINEAINPSINITGFADTDGDSLQYSQLGTWPPGITLIYLNNTTAKITGTPTQSGSFTGLMIEASDGTASITTPSFDITVNLPPPLAITLTNFFNVPDPSTRHVLAQLTSNATVNNKEDYRTLCQSLGFDLPASSRISTPTCSGMFYDGVVVSNDCNMSNRMWEFSDFDQDFPGGTISAMSINDSNAAWLDRITIPARSSGTSPLSSPYCSAAGVTCETYYNRGINTPSTTSLAAGEYIWCGQEGTSPPAANYQLTPTDIATNNRHVFVRMTSNISIPDVSTYQSVCQSFGFDLPGTTNNLSSCDFMRLNGVAVTNTCNMGLGIWQHSTLDTPFPGGVVFAITQENSFANWMDKIHLGPLNAGSQPMPSGNSCLTSGFNGASPYCARFLQFGVFQESTIDTDLVIGDYLWCAKANP